MARIVGQNREENYFSVWTPQDGFTAEGVAEDGGGAEKNFADL